jgi:NADPH:quinone reductase-like Zn-dependent oxidoreductase
VLINGAAGGVGTFAVQIAKALGGNVSGVCSTRNVEMVRSLGADRVIDYMQQDFTEEGQRYDLLLDNVGNRELSAFRRVMAARGRCVMVGAPKELWAVIVRVLQALAWPPFLPQEFTFFIAKVNRHHLEALYELMKTGKVTPVIEKRYQLSELPEAIAYLEQGHARAKLVVTVK